jgi:5-methyltetrahydrofolate--homocysteine methyltransferase
MNAILETSPIAAENQGLPRADGIRATQRRLTGWWDGSLQEPILDVMLYGRPKIQGWAGAERVDANAHWPTPECQPDFKGVARAHVANARDAVYAGDALPHAHHLYGGRGTPMTASFYEGAPVVFKPDMVWIEPFIRELADFDPAFDPENPWLKKSLVLFEAQVAAGGDEVLACVPGLGDFLTNLSLMRGATELNLDMLESPDEIHRLRERMVPLFIRFYKMFQERFQAHHEGTISWLAWAPGTTYPIQCDFSTMISPKMFNEFVVPEIKMLATHLTHMAWHLDGEDELRHLDTLLAIPEIKAIQWVPRSGSYEAYLPKWFPLIRRILDAGKAFHGIASIDEAKRALDELPHRGLFLRIRDQATPENIDRLGKCFGLKPW